MLYKIYYPSSIANQSLYITSNDNDTVTTSNGTIYRNMQVQTYNFNATGSSGYTAGNIFIDNVDQGSSTVSNYVVQKDINITVGSATYVGIMRTFTFNVTESGIIALDEYNITISYTGTVTSSVTNVTSPIQGALTYTMGRMDTNYIAISHPEGSTYSVTFTIPQTDDAVFSDGSKSKTFSGTIPNADNRYRLVEVQSTLEL